MGGLLAREYISDAARAQHVDTLVELGTPHVGSPKFVANLLYASCPTKQLAFFCVPNGQETNKLVQNFPGAFELLPSKLYYQLYPSQNNYPFNDSRDIDANGVKGPLDYNGFKTLLTNIGKNMNIFTTAENFHDTFDATYSNDPINAQINGVKDYLIVGSGKATIGQIHDYNGVNIVNLIRSPFPKISQDADIINGDDTVPLLSASLNHQHNVYYTQQEHGDLPTGAGLNMAVNLINGITDASSVSTNDVQTTPFDYSGRIIGVYSPAQLDAYDDQNNHTGIASDGTIEENIPGSSYDEIGEAKFIYLPSGGHYHIATKATGEGSFDLKVKNYTASQLTQQTLYLNIQQTASTTATMNLDDTNPSLSVDENGDGINIQSISPSYTLTGTAASDYALPYTIATLSPNPSTQGTYTNPVTVSMSAVASAEFSVANTYYTIDGGSQQLYTAPFVVLGLGSHTITYWSVDNKGLTEVQNTKTFTIAASILAHDTFQRANQTHWGTASDGNVWGSDASSNSTFSISGNAGQVANTGGTTYTAILGSTAADIEVVVIGKLSSFTNDPNIGAVSRFTDANNWYKAYIDGDSLVIQKKVQGTTTTLKTNPFLAAANTLYTIKFQVIGTTLQARVWQTDQTEPQTWQATVTDTSLSSGNTGLRILAHDATATVTNFTSSNLSMNPTPTLTPTPTPSTVISRDTFTRTNQSHWGTASDGHTWLGDANTSSAFSINSNTGKVVSNGTSYSAILGVTTKNAQVLFSGSLSSFDSSNIGSVVRWTDTNNWYKAYIDGSNIIIQKKVNGTATTLKTVSFAATAGKNYTLRFQVVGTALSAKVWKTTDTEPSNWTATVSDTSLSSGYCGLRMLTQNTISASYTSFIATSL